MFERNRWLTFLIAVALVATTALADEPDTPDKPTEPAEEEALSITSHDITVGGRSLAYTATAGRLPLLEEDGAVKANVFFVAYTLDDVEERAARAITFVFNGGPGSSSVWLHMGAWGPRRVDMTDKGDPIGPPYRLVDNEATLLDLTDLVFIDPVTTGYSRAEPEEDPGQFHGVQEDIESVAEFIRLYTTRFARWRSPKFIAGESYGTTRAAGLSGHLQQRHGMFLNGVILVSAILDFGTVRNAQGNDLPAMLYMPSFAMTARYHDRLAAPEQGLDVLALRRQAETFANGDYMLALVRGDTVTDAQRSEAIAELSRLTGLSPGFVERADMRLSMSRFTKELLRDRDRTVGRLDSRFLGIDDDGTGDSAEYDPSYAAIQGPYTALLNAYVREDLDYESDLPYEILTGRVRPWNYGRYQNRYVNVAGTLRDAMTTNPALRVFVASGYYDLATPYFATDYTIRHMGLAPSLRDHIRVRYYEAGHMMYIHTPSREKLRRDLEVFYKDAMDAGPTSIE